MFQVAGRPGRFLPCIESEIELGRKAIEVVDVIYELLFLCPVFLGAVQEEPLVRRSNRISCSFTHIGNLPRDYGFRHVEYVRPLHGNELV